MYALQVFYPGSPVAHEMHLVRSAAEVLSQIPALLQAHEGCERVLVTLNGARLFSVDCAGNTHPG